MSRFLHPGFLLVSVWVVTVGISWISPAEVNVEEYSPVFYRFVVVALLVFLVGVWIGEKATPKRSRSYVISRQRVLNLSVVYMAVMMASLTLTVIGHYRLAGSSFLTAHGLDYYRFKVTEFGGAPFAGMVVFNYFFFSALAFLALFRPPKTIVAVIVIFVLLFGYLSTSRSVFFVAILWVTFMFASMKGRMPIKTIIVLLISLAAAFVGMALVVGRMSEDPSEWCFSGIRYLIGGSHALDQILQGIISGFHGMISFRPWYPLLAKIGIVGIGHMGLLPNYKVRFATNVYTMFGPYVVDFSVIGGFVFSLFAGFVSGLIYKFYKSNRTDPYLLLLHSLNLTILTLSVFYDFYTASGFTFASVVFGYFTFRYPVTCSADQDGFPREFGDIIGRQGRRKGGAGRATSDLQHQSS